MYILAIRFRGPAPDLNVYKRVGEAVCETCGVGYDLHLRVEECDVAEQIHAAKSRFVEFLSQSASHHNEHLPVIPVVMGLGGS